MYNSMFNSQMINKNLYKMFMLLSLNMFLLSMYIIYNSSIIIIDWEFFNLLNLSFNTTLMLDPKGVLFSSVVLFITSNVMKFSILYMSEEKFINRFNILIVLFVLSMNLLIFIPNMIVLLLGWDGLGIVSFILVIYYQNSKSLSAGLLTILTNRLGDIAIIICIILTMNQGHWNLNCMWNMPEYKIQCIMILLAAMTKSAQMPFSSWLPAAMAAPTPVSALVHSSTLVTAGVFLLIRFYNFISKFELFNNILLYVSILTTMLASVCGLLENDMKKIVALSTLSQLGLMMTTLSLGMLNMCFFHMVVHAMFKALLFICVGILINYNSHSQDLRWVGNLTKNMPVTSSCMIISILSMSGFPFLSSFYTKDIIMEFCVCNMNNMFMYMFMYMSIGLTMAYSTRMLYNIMFNSISISPFNMMSEDLNLMKTLILMTMPSMMSGSLISWLFISNIDHMMLSFNEMMLPLMIVVLSFIMSYIFSMKFVKLPMFLINFSSSMWFMVTMSTQMFMNSFMNISKWYLKYTDQSWLELMGGEGSFYMLNKYSTNVLNNIVYNPIKILVWSILSMILTMIILL
uniref:NADH-ubiquinone oxidoreductase chain 5 n=1 Tax=Pterobdella arugamensis TaxID=3410361 RepID=A0A343B6W7_9ANNE|nr:NADH dehydrogenase subunit 5 [Zeylanicobdella arugamensis]AQT26250.1 NADH dehydrogenase subunit 5 [Zeylanicobdella arugamensis]